MDRRDFITLTARTAALAAAGNALSGAADVLAASAGTVRVRHHQMAFLGASLWNGGGRVRVVQLSDIHVGFGTPAATLLEAQRLAHALKPDLLVLTGDYLNHSLAEIDALQTWIAGLPRPCVATLGNHDYYSGPLAIRRMFERVGVTTLCNESVTLDLDGRKLTVVGVDDGFTRRDDPERAFAAVALPDRALVLSHEPRTADRIGLHGGRLVLSGHTHGGQVVLPGITGVLTSLIGMRYVAGWYQAGDAQLYVNAGIGTSVPIARVGQQASPEIGVFDLSASAA